MRGLPVTDVFRVVTELGIEITERSGDELVALCPGHITQTGRADHNPSWSINTKTGMHGCWSCGFSGGLLSLVVEVKGFKTTWGAAHDVPDYEAAKMWLGTLGTVSVAEMLTRVAEAGKYANIPKPVPMSEARLAVFTDPPDWALKARRLTEESCAYYGVRWDTKGRWITPIRDVEGGLMGWQEKGQVQRHFRNRPQGIKKRQTLFGIEQVYDTLHTLTVVVVESPLDAVRIHSAGVAEFATSSFGARIAGEQYRILRQADRVIVAMDNPRIDAAGRQACESILQEGRRAGMDMAFFDYGRLDVKDPGEMTDEQVRDGIAGARHSVYGIRAFLP